MFSAYLVGIYFALLYGIGLSTLPEMAKSMSGVGGESCWIYGSFFAYAAHDIGQLFFGLIGAFALWQLNRRGRCVLSLLLFVFIVAEALADLIVGQSCAQ